VTLTDLTLFII